MSLKSLSTGKKKKKYLDIEEIFGCSDSKGIHNDTSKRTFNKLNHLKHVNEVVGTRGSLVLGRLGTLRQFVTESLLMESSVN